MISDFTYLAEAWARPSGRGSEVEPPAVFTLVLQSLSPQAAILMKMFSNISFSNI